MRLSLVFLRFEQIFQNVAFFDIIHFHIDFLNYPFPKRIDVPYASVQDRASEHPNRAG
jgi:hypothetical protein